MNTTIAQDTQTPIGSGSDDHLLYALMASVLPARTINATRGGYTPPDNSPEARARRVAELGGKS